MNSGEQMTKTETPRQLGHNENRAIEQDRRERRSARRRRNAGRKIETRARIRARAECGCGLWLGRKV